MDITNLFGDAEYHPNPIGDLMIARDLIDRNPNLIKDYPSLEDALKLLNHVISSEEDSSMARQLKGKPHIVP